MSSDDRRWHEPGRWPARPVRVDYYTVQPSADQWVVVATVSNACHTTLPSPGELVVGAAASRDGAIGDMVRRLTRVVAPAAAG